MRAVQDPVIDPWDCRRWWPAALLLAVAVLIAAWRQRPGELRLPHDQAEAWMAETLPGIGPRTREAMATAIRHGHLDALPHRAQAGARRIFLWPDEQKEDQEP